MRKKTWFARSSDTTSALLQPKSVHIDAVHKMLAGTPGKTWLIAKNSSSIRAHRTNTKPEFAISFSQPPNLHS
jgi:hypothetical protein